MLFPGFPKSGPGQPAADCQASWPAGRLAAEGWLTGCWAGWPDPFPFHFFSGVFSFLRLKQPTGELQELAMDSPRSALAGWLVAGKLGIGGLAAWPPRLVAFIFFRGSFFWNDFSKDN